MLLAAGFGGGQLDRLEDLRVPRAPAEISAERLADFFSARTLVLHEQRLRREDHPRLTEAALERAAAIEGVLNRIGSRAPTLPMQRREPFDRHDLFPDGVYRQRETRQNGLSVNEHGARAAIALVATLLRPGEGHGVAKGLEKRPVRRYGDLQNVAIHEELQRGHEHTIL